VESTDGNRGNLLLDKSTRYTSENTTTTTIRNSVQRAHYVGNRLFVFFDEHIAKHLGIGESESWPELDQIPVMERLHEILNEKDTHTTSNTNNTVSNDNSNSKKRAVMVAAKKRRPENLMIAERKWPCDQHGQQLQTQTTSDTAPRPLYSLELMIDYYE
jgi:hypothetical protein